MRAFQVHLNKKRLCLAGIGDDGVMSAILSHLSKGDEVGVRSPRDRAQEKRYRKLHVRRMAKELGWKIIAPKKAPLQ